MTYSADDVAALLPLPTPTFHILIALADGERHGYAILQDIEARTSGAVRMSAGTLYRAIQRLVEEGVIVEVAKRPAKLLDDERRRYYRLTQFGLAVARAETARLQEMVKFAHAVGLTPRHA
jgi:DNA-binding PadR family transcriptional regulator